MAHFIRVIKAAHVKKKWVRLQEEKNVGMKGGKSKEEVEYKKKKHNFFDRCFLKLKDPNSIQHFVTKSFLGFMGGVLLTYIFFFFFYFCINISLRNTVYICALTGIVLCLGLAYSSKVRCYVFLLLPVFFSKQGRQALLAYALFLAFTGPAKNTMHNMGILSDSMSCSQEIIKRTLKQIYEMVKAPFKSVKETLEKMTKALQEVIDTVQNFVNKIKRIILAVLNVIKKGASWLGSIINFCNKKVGTPFQRCMKTFDDAITDCKAKLGVMDFLCHVVHVVKGLCYTVKWLDFICMFTEFVADHVIGVVRKKLNDFGLQMKTLFYVSIEFSHTYEFETTASNSTKHIAKTILQKISSKIEKLQQFFSFFGFVFGFLFLFVFFKVYYYKYKFMSSDRFDNVYLSKYITELDMKRADMDRETVLPLEVREKKKYAKPTSLRLLKSEKSRMTDSLFLLSLASFKVFSFVFCDYSLFWVLLTIYEAGHDAFQEEEKSEVTLHVEGRGVIANFYRKLGKTFEVPQKSQRELNPLHCLPDPLKPDTGRYMQIGFLVGLCWLFTVTEAYGMRLRHVVMSYYYPDRARERAVWLYNHILQSRASFLRFARRELRRKLKDGQKIEKVTFKQWLFATCPLLEAMFGKNKETSCLLCGAQEKKDFPLKRCKTPDCVGKYCINCFVSLHNTCTVCKNPIDYGDVSDISEEIDSSDEDYFKYRTKGDMHTFTDTSEENKFMTFRDLEYRDRFKDVESNKMVDYAKISDLYSNKEAIKARLREILQNRIKKLQEKKYKSSKAQDIAYQRLKYKLKNLIAKRKKLTPKEYKKLDSSSKFNLDEKHFGRSDESKVEGKKGKVFFEVTNENENYSKKYKKLKDKLRERIAVLKAKQLHSNLSKEKWDVEKKDEIPLFYCFNENENDLDILDFQSPNNDFMITDVTTTLDDLFNTPEATHYIL